MVVDPQPVEVMIWTNAERGPLVQAVVDRMGAAVVIVGVGGPDAPERERLASRWGCASGDDFRKLLIDRPGRYVLIAMCDGLQEGDFAAAVAQGAVVLTLEPVSSALDEWIASRHRTRSLVGATATVEDPNPGRSSKGKGFELGRVVQLPSLARSPGWLSAADPAEAVGAARLIAISSFGQRKQWSLYAHLFDAWKVVLGWASLPVTVDASWTGPGDRVPEDVRQVTGHLSAHARLRNGCGATVSVSDLAGCHHRRLEVVGDGGHLTLEDRAYRLWDTQGDELDRLADRSAIPVGFDELIAGQWLGLMRGGVGAAETGRIVHDSDVVACCLASLLSARTGEPERPQRLLELHGFA